MTKNRIENALNLIKYAILNNTSVSEASIKHGYSYTYVKNIKALVYDKYENGTLDDETFTSFDNLYKEYLSTKQTPIDTDTNTRFDKLYKDYLSTKQSPTNINEEKPLDTQPKNNTQAGDQIKYSETTNGEAVFEWKGSGNYLVDHIKTLDELLKATKVDTDIWKVKDFVVNKWDVTSWKSKIPQTIQNFQVKARLERDSKLFKERAVGEMFKEMVANYKAPVFEIDNIKLPTSVENDNLFEVTLFDLHIGKLAWGGETGENYDTKIARERYLATVETLIDRASGFPFSKIVFPIGSDFFNSDTIYNTTTKGTPQDEDLRWQKTFQVGVGLIVDAINLLKQTGVPVDVVVIPGNHDFERSYYMGEYLFAWFNNDPMVNINNGASPRKYYRFGKVLLGYTHGSEEKESALPLLMASDIESKPMWSETTYHEWHVGHIHRKRDVKYLALDSSRMTNEDLGVTVRYLSSLTGTEEWHHKKGFVGATKAGEAFIWNAESGMIAHLNANLIIK